MDSEPGLSERHQGCQPAIAESHGVFVDPSLSRVADFLDLKKL
jgi:hypothetical protein